MPEIWFSFMGDKPVAFCADIATDDTIIEDGQEKKKAFKRGATQSWKSYGRNKRQWAKNQ